MVMMFLTDALLSPSSLQPCPSMHWTVLTIKQELNISVILQVMVFFREL